MAKTVCDNTICTGCKACLNVCNNGAVEVRDNLVSFEPVIDTGKCVDCGLCTKVCPNTNPRELKETIYSKQGWAADNIRSTSSSGGAASALIEGFIRNNGYVASCVFKEGEFRFVITNDLNEAKGFAGSKYVKSDPELIYKEIKARLAEGSKVLFIGLPCQVAAVLNVCGESDNIYTADLICHGTPSVRLLKMYLDEKGIDLEKAKDIRFRDGNNFGLIIDGRRLMPGSVPDYFTYSFLKSVDYIESCYDCRYATSKRVSDITLGDAWGQMSDTDQEGVSLILCQSKKGIDLIEQAGLTLFDVDLGKAVRANSQLSHPSEKPAKRDAFIKRINEGGNYTKAMRKTFPEFCIKNAIKSLGNRRKRQ